MILLDFLFSVFLIDIIVTAFFTLIMMIIFISIFRKYQPWPNYLLFFLVLFLGTWAGGVWLTPVGPTVWNIFWLPFLITAIILMLFMSAIVSGIKLHKFDESVLIEEDDDESDESSKKQIISGLFLWLVIGILVVSIFLHYVV